MKTYIKPSASIVKVKAERLLNVTSGGNSTLQGGSNGDYSSGVNLGSRRGETWDEEE